MRSSSHFRHMVVAVVVTAATLLGLVAVAQPAAAAGPSATEVQMATMVNDYRIANGRAPLPIDAGLSSDARAWSSRMASRRVLQHDANFDRSCQRFAGYTTCRENVGYSPAGISHIQSELEKSAGHRTNLLCDCTHIGIGIVVSGGRTFVTQRLVNDGRSATPPMLQSLSPYQLEMARSYVRATYSDFFRRTPAQSELDHWAARVLSPSQRNRFVWSLAYSDEWVGSVVEGFYKVALGRSADPQGKQYWVDVIQRGAMAPAEVAARFYASDEYFARRGHSFTRWVDSLYSEVLGRSPDAEGRAHWVDVARKYGRTAVAATFYDSAETLRVRVDDVYQKLLGRWADDAGSSYWSHTLNRTKNDVRLALSLATSTEYRRRAVERF